ncbi:MAG: hypothetical protein AAF270_13620 [Pseudomonadota bacterium]
MTELIMPTKREFGWDLKPTSSSHFDIHKSANGQFCVVLNHALLRGISAHMIHWWFMHFAQIKVRLRDVPGYEGQRVPAYLLWHPVDHLSAELSGKLGPDFTAQPGCSIHIREAMQYDRYRWKYPVDSSLRIFYVGPDGWAMGKALPILGPVMMLRIHFKDVHEHGRVVGVHYHYEVVIGASGDNPLARFVNRRLTAEFGPEFFAAWQRHNVIEVGTFERFLAPLFAQRDSLGSLEYAPDMAPDIDTSKPQQGFDRGLFDRRLQAYAESDARFSTQAFDQPTFL